MPAPRLSTALLALIVCVSCSEQSSDDIIGVAAEDTEISSLRINEVFVASEPAAIGMESNAWIELTNVGAADVWLYEYALTIDGEAWELPDFTLAPGALYVVRGRPTLERPDAGASFLSGAPERLALVRKRDQAVIDHTDLPKALQDESLARYPNGTGQFSVYPAAKATAAAPNLDLGFISKLASATEFRPRDSSTNAIVRYAGFYWILGGWSNFGHDEWHSYADVWKSADGVRWTLVNTDPPYSHYDSFVVWRDRMWAIGPESFSSTDGVLWRPEPILSRIGNRSVVFHDAIVNVDGARVMTTSDGEAWTVLTESAPWGESRQQPLVTTYRDRIWVIGGFSAYGEPGETLHSDVWSSADGVTWELITPRAAWAPRVWQSVHAYDDKIFMLNGVNWNTWPDEYGNTAEIWYTEDGARWYELPSESQWGARHASYSAVDDEGALVLFAGYGHGGVERIYNDAWRLRASLYFPKPSGDLRSLSTWGKNLDGSGPPPRSFADDHQIFVLRNRAFFALDSTWSVTGAGSRIVVGDGDGAYPVWLALADEEPRRLYLHSNSTTAVHGSPPIVGFRHPDATLVE